MKNRLSFKTILSLIWLVFTASLVVWWWIYAFKHITTGDDVHKEMHMLYWEGSVFLLTVLVGGAYLVFYSFKDQERHDKLRFFFANFSHDVKTSISRLRLEGDILKEELSGEKSPLLNRFLKDLSLLDLQLENSLMMSQLDEKLIFNESIDLAQMINYLKVQFDSDLAVNVSGNAKVKADTRVVRSILRNIFENSLRHGKAKKIDILIEQHKHKTSLKVKDNGVGSQINIEEIGQDILSHSVETKNSNGMGLYLATQLMKKMRGNISFSSEPQKGFECVLEFST